MYPLIKGKLKNLEEQMFRKTVLILMFISFIGVTTTNNSSSAFFFKKHKTGSRQVTKNVENVEQKAGEKKIVLAEIYASWCPGCKNIQPTLDLLVKDFSQIELVQLDVSTPSKAEASQKLAKDLKIIDFYNVNKSKTATVGIIVPTSGEVVSVLHNENSEEVYKPFIQDAQAKEKELQLPPS